MRTLSQRAYARHRREKDLNGGTLQAVRKALETGRITANAEGLINDPAIADRQWAARTAPRVFASGRKTRAVPRPAAGGWGPTTAQTKHWSACRDELHRLHDVLGDDVDELKPAGYLIGDGPPRLDALCTAYNEVIDAMQALDEVLQQPSPITGSAKQTGVSR